MSYSVTPGPLPADGDVFDPRTTIPAFVNGTEITGLPNTAFDLSQLTFIASQTDAPTDPRHGFLWFKRGEGQLYIADSPQFSASPGVTGYTAVYVGVGPRIETILLYGNEAPAYNVLYPGLSTGYYKDSDSLLRPRRITPRGLETPGNTGTSNSQGYLSMFLTRTTGESRAVGNGGMVPVVIRGFADANVHSGVTCVPGQRAVVPYRIDRGVNNELVWILSSDHHSADSLTKLLGYIVDSSGTAAAGRARIYKVGITDTWRW